ncbi:hypothetical protein M569_14439 [Genlisea aurea]|uniref:Uncharacterized protein n=1 Tax=Genlisea aurea TaxID=192259 RepID=S8C131_9LAMI|nr:hypothetical protein M569_14439 [Genlisea aurea]
MSNQTLSSNYSQPKNDFGVSYYYVYVHPVISLVAILIGLVCSIVLASKEMRTKAPFFRYWLVNSAGVTFALVVLIPLFAIKCNTLCSFVGEYWIQVYLAYIINYVLFSIYDSAAVILIIVQINMYFSIKNISNIITNANPYLVCAIIIDKQMLKTQKSKKLKKGGSCL